MKEVNEIIDEPLVFEVLGHRLRLTKDNVVSGVTPVEVVEYVQSEIDKMKITAPALSHSQVSVLLMLKLAGEKIALEKDFRTSIDEFKRTASEALQFIEEVSPTTH